MQHYGKRYLGSDLSSCDAVSVDHAEIILNWMKNPKNILLYHGTAGIGKTKLCASLTSWAFKKFNSFRYHKEEDILRTLREGMGDNKGDYLTKLNFMTDDDFVILDDVGSGINPSKSSYRDLEFRREVFYSFLDHRYNSMLPTIITSNFSKQEFDEVYSKRISSRLFAKENTIIYINDDSKDMRKLGY